MANNNGLFGLFKAISEFTRWFVRQKHKYNEIKQDEQRAKKSIHFGASAICFVLIGLSLSALIVYGGFAIASNTNNILAVIFGAIVIILGGLLALVMLPYSLTCIVLQLKMNRRLIGFLSLIIFVAFCVLIALAATRLQWH